MINKRLIKTSSESLKYVKIIVICQLISMLANVLLIFTVATFINDIYTNNSPNYIHTIIIYLIVITTRSFIKIIISKMSVKTSSKIKIKLRKNIYSKILRLGGRYTGKISTAEVIQVASEGVDQLEMYFSSYLPQFFYCLIAPIILFLILSQISFKASFVLFICVPLIPISIIAVQKIAKKLLEKYWELYTHLGDNFLENIQGMTTLKIYGADETFHQEMNKSSENFRKITMKVLSMQLNSIIVMDIIAYGGTALGTVLSIIELQKGQINLIGALVIILLSSEFFLPMRMLGSFFHIAMNGMSASDKMFKILDMNEPTYSKQEICFKKAQIEFKDVTYSYENTNDILKNISFTATTGLTSIVGISGSGKSTIASLIISKLQNFSGNINICGINIENISQKDLFTHISYITDKGYIFSGTVEDNLKMANENATEQQMQNALKQANIWDFLSSQNGLKTQILERGSNLSGGEKQRLNIARALLLDSDIYIFDEITSNIDTKSEDDIMRLIIELSKNKVVILISHRLQNVIHSNQILMLQNGKIIERGCHTHLLNQNFEYAKLYNMQKSLEMIRGEYND